MKAIVMAGGKGTRLRPLTIERPKPMVRLFDKPVLEYILRLLKKHGVTDVCLTLGYMSESVREYVESNDFGMNIECRTEKEPMGTAGGVKACEDFIGGEDFIVISGDAMCDFDLTECMEKHKGKNAEATIVLCSREDPLEYGLVVTGRGDRVESFAEKPPWENVCTDCINTGVYILSPSVLSDIPDGEPYDFGKDLFPKLLSSGRRLFGVKTDGYWCDIGSPEALVECMADMLDGKMDIEFSAPQIRHGVWSEAEIPEEITVLPPVFIGKGVTFGKGVKIGPYAAIGENSRVSVGSSVVRSIADGASVGERTSVTGAILCHKVKIGRDSAVEEGAVIGDGTLVSNRCYISRGVKIWPGKTVPEGSRIRENIVTGLCKGAPAFGGNATISGEFNLAITPEMCVSLGSAMGEKRVGISSCGGEAAQVLAAAIECGARASGAEVVRLDCQFPSCASYSAERFNLPVSAMVRQIGANGEIMFFEGCLPMGRERQRKIEAAFSGELKRATTENAGMVSNVSGTLLAYVASAAKQAVGVHAMPKVWAGGTGSANRALRQALCEAGCTVTERKKGVPAFTVSADGFSLTAYDEDGKSLSPDKITVLCALGEFENGEGQVAVPYSAPAALEILASAMGGKVLRLERDGEKAKKLYARQTFMRDGIFAAVYLCACMSKRGESLAEMASRIPGFFTVTREVAVRTDRAKAMRIMAESCAEMAMEMCGGLKIDTEAGTVHINPSAVGNALFISSEGKDEKTAEKLCRDFEQRARKII